MNERNIVLVAVLLIVGLSFFNSADEFTGKALIKGPASCEYLTSTGIDKTTIIRYDPLTTDGIAGKDFPSTCATDHSVSMVGCKGGHAIKYIQECGATSGKICKNGACVKGTVVTRDTKDCFDSDLGANELFTAGYIETYGDLGGGRANRIYDACAVSNDRFGDAVTEHSCTSAGKATSRIQQCPSGSKCINGRCN